MILICFRLSYVVFVYSAWKNTGTCMYASMENEIVNLEIRNVINMPTLSDEDSNKFEGLITKQESLSALRQMRHDKSLVQMIIDK